MQVDNRPRLLLIEDDRELSGLLAPLLEEEGYRVSVAHDGQRGLHLGLTRHFDVVVLDRGLPALEGLDLLGRLRDKGLLAPVLVLSARGSTKDRVDGLDAGAEDYLTKPFEVAELLARLRALLRRHADDAGTLRLGSRTLVLASRTVHGVDGTEITLSERECALLATLASRPKQVFPRGELLDRVFGEAESEAVVDTYVHYLRRKLGRTAVRTVRGVGYRMGDL